MPSPTIVLSSVAVASLLSTPAWSMTCDSIHAAKIAAESGLEDCDKEEIRSTTVASGSALSAPYKDICVRRSANECAAYFRDHPEHGLIANPARAGVYRAFHVGAAQGLLLPDGTRPMVYYKPAPGTIATNPHFNSWIFYFYGGAGMCSQDVVQRGRGDGAGMSSLASQGADCFAKLDYASQSEQKAGTGFNRLLHMDFSGYGILGDTNNAVFANYNRVVITKSNDFYIGDLTKPDVDVGSGMNVKTMQLQGNAIVKSVFAFFTTPVGSGADLDDASHVLFVASSSGTNSVHRVDEWHQEILGYAPQARVGLMLNSSGVTPDSFALEDYDDAPCGSIYAGNCGATFDDRPHGETLMTGLRTVHATAPRTLRFSHATFLDYAPTYWNGASDGQLAPGMEAHNLASVSGRRDSVLDRSCLDIETPADDWKCRSPIYLMLNHLRTPLFIAHSLRDSSNISGVVKGIASRDADGNLPRWNKIEWYAGNPLSIDETPMESLARYQFTSWVTDRNDPNGATGESRIAGPMGVWAPNCDQHEPEKDDRTYSSGRVTIGSPVDNSSPLTLQEALVQWFLGGVTTVRIDGFGASETISSGAPDGCQ